jgi:tetratricopeptide (TPR) repeat protein
MGKMKKLFHSVALPSGVVVFFAALLAACNPDGNRLAPEGAYVAATEAYAQERYTEALEYVRESLRINPGFHQARFLEGKILFFQNRLDEAQKTFSALTVKYPEYTEARIWTLRCMVLSIPGNDMPEHEKRVIEARTSLEKELTFNSTDWRVFYLYALLAGKAGDWEKRLSMGRRAETALSDSSKVYLDMAFTWHSLGLEDRAGRSLEKARVVSGTNISLAQMGVATEEFLNPHMYTETQGDYREK